MKKHPNADIEWYDDGMTMKEQEEWAKEHKVIRPKIQIVMSRDRCVISHVNSACSATYSVHDSHVISA